MSGKQAKAKRKIAKNVDGNADFQFGGVINGTHPDRFSLSNVRCFAEEQRVPIRPITLLVGENSAGKTTFLGAYSIFHRLAMKNDANSAPPPKFIAFDEPPFHMGAFRDIVRSPIGKRAPLPQFTMGGSIPFCLRNGDKSRIDVAYSFREGGSEPIVSEVSLGFQSGAVVKAARKTSDHDILLDVEISGPGFRMQKFVEFSRTMPLWTINFALTADFMPTAGVMAGSENEMLAEIRNAFCMREPNQKLRDLLQRNSYSYGTGLLEGSGTVAFAPGCVEPKRTYNPESIEFSPTGRHTPMLLAELFRTRKAEWEDLRKRLVAFGKESGMFSDFKVKGLGAQVNNPFQIQVKAGKLSNIIDVGHGVGQIYPLLTQIMRESQLGKRCAFLLQDPELALHPRAQAALASFLVNAARNDGHAFLIETHGDAIIDRVRICVSNGLIPPEDVVILYFEAQPRGNVKIHPIRMDKMANLLDAPKGYRKFFMDEGNLLLGFKKLPKGQSRVRNR